MSKNSLFLLGMIASIAAAVAGQAKDFPHPWDKILGLGGIAGTAITAYLAQHPRLEWTEEKRQDHRDAEDLKRLTAEEK